MKYTEIVESIQALDEVRMGDSDLAAFIKTPVAQSMRAGFEAELCFEGLGGSGETDYDAEPEPNYSDDPRARSIDDIANFYYDGDYNGRRAIQDLKEEMLDNYLEWKGEQLIQMWAAVLDEEVAKYIEENEFDVDDAIEEYLIDTLELNSQQLRVALEAGKRAQEITSSKQLSLFADENEAYAQYAEARDAAYKELEEKVQEAINDMTPAYDSAREIWMEEHSDEFTERDWLESLDINTMSDVGNNYDIQWPHWTYPESESGNSYNSDGARALEKSLEHDLNVNVVASSNYHSTPRREGLWIIEPDGSLEAAEGDMPAEIISPPMPLTECLTKMREFFAWAKSENAYSNESTGLHVGVSLPDIGGRVDYVKLALFLGDKYVLDLFERDGNTYARSALDKIEADIKNSKNLDNRVEQALDIMKSGMNKLALHTIVKTSGHGKYTSINLKGDYVEFRSMGGSTYLDNIDTVINTVQRFVMAMAIAADPNAHKEEYAKKLYKLINPERTRNDTIQYFTKYVTGEIKKEQLKDFLKQTMFKRQADIRAAASKGSALYWWKVGVNGISMTIEVVAADAEGAKRVALENVPEWRQQGRHPSEMYAERLRIALS